MQDGHVPAQTKDENQKQEAEPDDYMRGVQPHERVERRPKKVCAYSQSLLVNELVPFESRRCEKRGSEHNGRQPPELKQANAISVEGALRKRDGNAARQ